MSERHAEKTIVSSGFTLIETLVVLAIVGLVVGLILPAIQTARQSAWRAACANNLRQLAVGLYAYQAGQGVFPPATTAGYSLHAALLPQLGEMSLYNSINFSTGAADFPRTGVNATIDSTTVGVFLCPADAPRLPLAWTSYAGNRGPDLGSFPYHGAFPYPPERPFGPEGFVDGTSCTTGISEWVLGPFDPRRISAMGSVLILDIATPPLDDFCQGTNPRSASSLMQEKGSNWKRGDYYNTLYNHTLSINSSSCAFRGSIQDGIYSAGSYHPAGANVLMMDGTVRFTQQSMSLALWRALGTRDGSEMIERELLD